MTGYPANADFYPVSRDFWVDADTGAIIGITDPSTFTTPIVTDAAGAGSLTILAPNGQVDPATGNYVVSAITIGGLTWGPGRFICAPTPTPDPGGRVITVTMSPNSERPSSCLVTISLTGYPATSNFYPVSQELWIDVNTGAILGVSIAFTFTTPIVTDAAGAGSLTILAPNGQVDPATGNYVVSMLTIGGLTWGPERIICENPSSPVPSTPTPTATATPSDLRTPAP